MSRRASAECTDCGWSGGPYRSEKQAAYALRRHSCAKTIADRAYAQARDDKAAERERLIDRTPQPCHHKQANHQHGTYVAYTSDRCRCWPCTEASRTYNAALRRRNAYGRSNLVDAQPARDRIKALMAAGIGLKQVTVHTGINGGVLCKLMYGTKDNGYQPSRKVAKHNLQKILALDPTDPDLLADGVRWPTTGARRRVQALVHQGWSVNKLADAAGTDRQRLDGVLRKDTCTLATHKAIVDLYDRLWDQSPPQATRGDRTAYGRARGYAARNGWVGPLAWDDDQLDDPTAVPHVDDNIRAPGKPRTIHVEDVDFLLHQADYTWDGLVARLGFHKVSIDRALRRAGRTDLIRRLTDNTTGSRAA